MGCSSSKQAAPESRASAQNPCLPPPTDSNNAVKQPLSLNDNNSTARDVPLPSTSPPEDTQPVDTNLPKMVAEYDYQKRSVADIDLLKGDVVYLMDNSNEDWFKVQHVKTGKKGYVPSNFLIPWEENQPKDAIQSASWYFSHMSRVESEQLLTMCEVPGTFLVRPSDNPVTPHTLSVLDSNRKIKHFRIKFSSEKGFSIANDVVFETLNELVEYYRSGKDSNIPKLIKIAPKGAPDTAGLGKDVWEVNRTQIQLLSKLGSGNFGDVWKGLFNGNIPVAVKTLKEGKMDPAEFLKEANIMKTIKHKKLVQLLAVCTTDQPMLIICEFMENGSLKDYLPSRKDTINYGVLVSMCLQCCEGMAYMESVNMIHRDLAARNILISKNLDCKIADFGMSVLANDKTGQGHQNGKIPIRWTAPEAIKKGIFSNKSDVWSYGILAWEILTYCQLPYTNMNNQETLAYVFEGKILPKPNMCTESLYQTMSLCWIKGPDERPTFKELELKLNEEVKKLNASGGLYSEL